VTRQILKSVHVSHSLYPTFKKRIATKSIFRTIVLQRLERLHGQVSGHDEHLDQIGGDLCPAATSAAVVSSKTSAIDAVSYLLNIRQGLDNLQPYLDRQSDRCSFLSVPD